MKIEKGKKAGTAKGMRHNIEVMKKAGYSDKRAKGTAYGEVGEEKKARRNESKAMNKHMDEKEDKRLVKKMVKKSCMK